MTRRKANNSGTNLYSLPQKRLNKTGKYKLLEIRHTFFNMSGTNV